MEIRELPEQADDTEPGVSCQWKEGWCGAGFETTGFA